MNLQKTSAPSKFPLNAAIGLSAISIIALLTFNWLGPSGPFHAALENESIQNSFPESFDEALPTQAQRDTQSFSILPMGYTLGAWPSFFQGEPIVTKLTYQKGPPKKFLQALVQVWKPVEVELTIEGPRTIEAKTTGTGWKKCFSSRFLCKDEKKLFTEYAAPEFEKDQKAIQDYRVTWFESLDPTAARGVHLQIFYKTYTIDRYTVITDRGAAQNFSLKLINSPTGAEAQTLFAKIMGGLKSKDELSGSRTWIQNKIQTVKLNQIRTIPDPRYRMMNMIQVQNWIFSLLTVAPTQIQPFFHLAGVTHLLALDLLKAKQSYFENQEAWILNSKPQLEALIKYGRDFEPSAEQANVIKNMEALLQDFLLTQQRMTGMNR